MPWAKRYAFAVTLCVLGSLVGPVLVQAQGQEVDASSGFPIPASATPSSAKADKAGAATSAAPPAASEITATTDETTRKEAYREAIEAGLKEFRAGNWPEAIRWFEAAHQADPNARTLRGLGHAHFEYRSYVRAVDYLQQALENNRRPLTASQRRETKNVLARAKRFLVLFSVEVTPKDAEILVDGYPAEFDADGKMLLNPGVRSVVVQHPDYYTHNQQFEVLPGAGGVLRVDLTPKPIPVPEVATAPEPEVSTEQEQAIVDTTAYIPPKDPLDVPVGAWILSGTGAALLTAAAITGARASSIHSDLEKDCPGFDCPDGYDGQISAGKKYKLATNILLGTGLLSLAGGVTWWLIDWQIEETPSTVAGLVCTDEGCAATVSGKF